ncbi:MAG: DUF6069 family protein [Bacteroidia bacterium]
MASKITISNALKAGLYAGIIASAINVILFLILHSMGVITDDIEIQPGQSMTMVPILISSILPTLIGSLIYFLFDKYSAKGMRNFMILSVILLLLSFANPFMGIPGVTTAYAISLNVMHVVVFGALVFMLRKENEKLSLI